MELFVKQELVKSLPQIDAILLDVDGVILDVAQTFQVVAANVAQLLATQWMNLEDDGALFEPLECEHFKNAGGFNNDWDLTNGVVALALAQHVKNPKLTSTAQLRAECDWTGFTRDIKRRGGGLQNAEHAVLEMLAPAQRRDFARAWNPKLVTQIFQEMYAGDAQCKSLYGFDPEHVHGDGYLDRETVLIDAKLLPKNVKIGVLTGRTSAETQIALSRAGLCDRIPESARVTESDGVRKPAGEALALLQQKIGFKSGVYIGDTMDDLSVVQNYREMRSSGRARCHSCIVLSGPAGATYKRMFLEAGAEIVAPDVNAVLQYLGSVIK